MTQNIQRVELRTYYYTPVYCPFCGARVMGGDPADETRITACPHTLFIAHDEAIEYRSARFDANVGLEGLSDAQVEARWQGMQDGIDTLTDQVTLPDAVKVVTYSPEPSAYANYYGFAPVDDAAK